MSLAQKRSVDPNALHASAKTPERMKAIRNHLLAPRYLGRKAAATKYMPPIAIAEKQAIENAKS